MYTVDVHCVYTVGVCVCVSITVRGVYTVCVCDTYCWQSLMRSKSVVAGGNPRMYRLVLLSCSQPVLLLLLLLLGLGGVMG